jgi:hypothetical protein
MGILPQAQRAESISQKMHSMHPSVQAKLASQVDRVSEIFPGRLHKDPGKRLGENQQDKGGQLKKLTWGTSPRNGGSKFGFPGKSPCFCHFSSKRREETGFPKSWLSYGLQKNVRKKKDFRRNL